MDYDVWCGTDAATATWEDCLVGSVRPYHHPPTSSLVYHTRLCMTPSRAVVFWDGFHSCCCLGYYNNTFYTICITTLTHYK